jgi:hypothetical protein
MSCRRVDKKAMTGSSLEGLMAANWRFFRLAVNVYLFDQLIDEVANHHLLRGLQHDSQRSLQPGCHGSIGCEHLFD